MLLYRCLLTGRWKLKHDWCCHICLHSKYASSARAFCFPVPLSHIIGVFIILTLFKCVICIYIYVSHIWNINIWAFGVSLVGHINLKEGKWVSPLLITKEGQHMALGLAPQWRQLGMFKHPPSQAQEACGDMYIAKGYCQHPTLFCPWLFWEKLSPSPGKRDKLILTTTVWKRKWQEWYPPMLEGLSCFNYLTLSNLTFFLLLPCSTFFFFFFFLFWEFLPEHLFWKAYNIFLLLGYWKVHTVLAISQYLICWLLC